MERNRIKDRIQELGLTYAEIGDEIGISAQAVSEIVAGRTRGASARYAVACALKTTVADLWPEAQSAPGERARAA